MRGVESKGQETYPLFHFVCNILRTCDVNYK